MVSAAVIWAGLLVASTAGGLIFAHVGSHSLRLTMATGGVLACIMVSSMATILLVTSGALGVG